MQVVSDATSAPPSTAPDSAADSRSRSVPASWLWRARPPWWPRPLPRVGLSELALVFVVLTTLEVVAYAHALRPWLHTGHAPRRGQLIQVLVGLLALLAFALGPTMGLIGLCALAAGAFLPNASTIRAHRVALSFTEPIDEASTGASGTPTDPSSADAPPARTRPAPQVVRPCGRASL